MAALLQQRIERRLAGRVARQVGDHLLGHDAGEQAVHALLRIADRHRRQRVAVIATPEGQELGPALHAPIDLELQRHLHGDLDRDRTAFGEEHVVQVPWQQLRQPRRQAIGRLVRQAAEHHVRHGLDLRAQGVGDVRMVVAVAGGPPRGQAVDQFAPVRQHQPRTACRHDRQRRPRGLHLAVRTPDMRRAGGQPLRISHRAFRLRTRGALPMPPLRPPQRETTCRASTPSLARSWPPSTPRACVVASSPPAAMTAPWSSATASG